MNYSTAVVNCDSYVNLTYFHIYYAMYVTVNDNNKIMIIICFAVNIWVELCKHCILPDTAHLFLPLFDEA